jgi:membrane protein involved in colicin uptake
MRLACIAILSLGLVLATPTIASAYVENEYVIKGSEQQNKEAVEREKAKEASEHEAAEHAAAEKAAKESAERKAVEERQQRERENRHSEEVLHAGQAPTPAGRAAAKYCVVPLLIGDSLSAAREALAKAHCHLGKVSTSRQSHAGPLVVTSQSTKNGLKRPAGTAVALMLGAAKHH